MRSRGLGRPLRPLVHIDTGTDQRAHALEVSALDRAVKRQLKRAISGRPRIGTSPEQESDTLHITRSRRAGQRRHSVAARDIGISTGRQQRPSSLGVAARRVPQSQALAGERQC